MEVPCIQKAYFESALFCVVELKSCLKTDELLPEPFYRSVCSLRNIYLYGNLLSRYRGRSCYIFLEQNLYLLLTDTDSPWVSFQIFLVLVQRGYYGALWKVAPQICWMTLEQNSEDVSVKYNRLLIPFANKYSYTGWCEANNTRQLYYYDVGYVEISVF